MKRRYLAKTAITGAATLVEPRIGRAADARIMTFCPHADLASIDPVWTTADITRNFSLTVFDTLCGYDPDFKVQPQMVEGHTTEADGKKWDLLLREGLKFHDGPPVFARTASPLSDASAPAPRSARR